MGTEATFLLSSLNLSQFFGSVQEIFHAFPFVSDLYTICESGPLLPISDYSNCFVRVIVCKIIEMFFAWSDVCTLHTIDGSNGMR